MRRITVLSLVLLTLSLAQAKPFDLAAGVSVGSHNSGLSLAFQGYADNIGGSAFGARVSFGFAFADAFNDNNAFYGTSGAAPKADLNRISDYKNSSEFDTSERGRNFTFSLDGTYDLGELFDMSKLPFTASVYAGPRINVFSGSFEVDDKVASVKSSQFGLGFGSLAFYPLSDNLSLVGDIGADIYFNSAFALDGSFGDLDVDPGDTAYNDYDGLINQPSLAVKIALGVAYSF